MLTFTTCGRTYSHDWHIFSTPQGNALVCDGVLRDSEEVMNETNTYFDGIALFKVFDSLLASGLDAEQAIDAMVAIQDAGIVFKERDHG